MLAEDIARRIAAVEAVCGAEHFRARLHDAVIAGGAAVRNGEDVRALAVGILDAMHVDRTGVSLVCGWDPSNRRVTVRVRRARRTALRTPGGGLRALGA